MQIYPLSERSLIVEFGKVISKTTHLRAIALAELLTTHPIAGFIEAVPAYTSVGVFYDPVAVRRKTPGAGSVFDAVSMWVLQLSSELRDNEEKTAEIIDVPVSFGRDCGPDLGELCTEREMSEDEFITIFLSRIYRVYMLGFLPGFAYMGDVDDRIASPRLATPRSRVPKGSVGIAGRQTGIYPFVSPGGWQLIGRTELELFDIRRNEPSLFSSGDRVRFVQV